MIIIPSNKFLEGEITSKVAAEGFFKLQAMNRYGRVLRERKFKNLITNHGLDNFGLANTMSGWRGCAVGIGTTPPQVTDISLANQVAWIWGGTGGQFTELSSTTSGTDSPPYWGQANGRYTFSIGQVSANLTEVGLATGTASTPSQLVCRALIMDEFGNPVAFPIASDEQLVVNYSLRVYCPEEDTVSNVTIDGLGPRVATSRGTAQGSAVWAPAWSGAVRMFVATNVSARRAYSGGLISETSTGTPSGDLGASTSIVNNPYVSGSHEETGNTIYGPGRGTGNIRTVTVNVTNGRWAIEYDPPIPKTSTQTLVLGHRISWGRR